MSVKLNTKVYDSFGYKVLGSDLTGSGDWIHAGTKLGLDKDQVTSIFDAYQNHSYFNVARGASGFLGKHKALSEQPNQSRTAFSGPSYRDNRGFDIGRGLNINDPFADLRMDNKQGFFKDKLDVRVDGDRVSYYDQAYDTQYETQGGAQGAGKVWSNQKPNQTFLGGQVGSSNVNTRQVATGRRDGELKSGRILNGAFIPNELYDQLSDTDKSYYGQTFDQAKQRDSDLAYGSQVVSGSYQYRRGRARSKSGLGAVGQLTSTLLGKPPSLGGSTTLGASSNQEQTQAQSPNQVTKLSSTNRRKRRAPTSGASGTILTGGSSLSGDTGKTLLGA